MELQSPQQAKSVLQESKRQCKICQKDIDEAKPSQEEVEEKKMIDEKINELLKQPEQQEQELPVDEPAAKAPRESIETYVPKWAEYSRASKVSEDQEQNPYMQYRPSYLTNNNLSVIQEQQPSQDVKEEERKKSVLVQPLEEEKNYDDLLDKIAALRTEPEEPVKEQPPQVVYVKEPYVNRSMSRVIPELEEDPSNPCANCEHCKLKALEQIQTQYQQQQEPSLPIEVHQANPVPIAKQDPYQPNYPQNTPSDLNT